MISYFIETSVIVDYLHGKESTRTLVKSLNGNLYSSHICLSELYEGVFRSNNSKKIEGLIKNFFEGLTYTFGLDEIIAIKFAEIRADLKKQGNVIEDIDIFIAATYLVNDLTLVTLNQKHFSRIKKLKLYFL